MRKNSRILTFLKFVKMRNSALAYFGAMCTLKTAFSKTLVSSNVNES